MFRRDELTHKLSRRRAGLRAAACAVILGSVLTMASTGVSGATEHHVLKPSATITLTEQDYYSTTSGPIYTYLNTLFSNFEASHPGITIKREASTVGSGAAYLTAIEDEAAAGTLPDVLQVDNPELPNIAELNVLTPLDSLGTTAISSLEAAQKIEASYKGTVYAYPLYTNTIALFYNKKDFAKAGLTPPTTWAELLTDAKALTTKKREGIAFSGQTGGGENVWTFEPFLWSNGGGLKDVNSAASVQALTLWVDLENEGALSPDAVSWSQGPPESYFADNTAAMMINGPWFFGTLNSVKGLSYGVVEIPTNKPGEVVVPPIGGEVWTIPKSNRATEAAAYELLNYMATPSVDEHLALATGDIPTVKAAVAPWTKVSEHAFKPFLDELLNGRVRTANLGVNYTAVETALGNGIEAALSHKQSPQGALNTAQKNIESIIGT